MAIEDKIPFIYSINSFLVFKGFEQIRMLTHMGTHVILTGTGLEDEYTSFGITHYSFGDKKILSTLPIKVLTPKTKEDVEKKVLEAYNGKGPYYLRLSRY
jgi:transketolase C-terminal domain/subunit